MSFFIYIFGLLLGIALFLYFLSIYRSGREKLSGLGKKNSAGMNGNKGNNAKEESIKNDDDTEISPEKIGFRSLSAIPPGSRMCPLCRAPLTKFEPLYAKETGTGSGKKIIIYGCCHCWKDKRER